MFLRVLILHVGDGLSDMGNGFGGCIQVEILASTQLGPWYVREYAAVGFDTYGGRSKNNLALSGTP